MAIVLEKGQRIGIGLQKVGVGLGWDPNAVGGEDFDLDASTFMLGENHRTGGSSDGDDETLNVDLSKVDPKITEIIFTATIYKAAERKQNFGQVHNSYIRIYNAVNNEEIARYDLDEDFSIETAVEFGRLYRRGSEWKFEALGLGNKGGMQALVDKYS